jgi:hypothetical protein
VRPTRAYGSSKRISMANVEQPTGDPPASRQQ